MAGHHDDTGHDLEGRSAARRVLAEALAGAAAGSGRLVLVTGEPGMGKTTLARAVADDARRLGVTVRWSACWAGGGTVAHAPWVTLLSGLGEAGAAAIDALVDRDVEAPGAGPAARALVYARVLDALGDAGATRPLLLVLDDLHWADEGSVQLLVAVAGSLPGVPALVVGTYRDAEIAPDGPLSALGASVERIGLTGLPRVGVAALLASSSGRDVTPDVADAVHRRTGGNPFLVTQIGRLLASDPHSADAEAVPAGARDVLESRLAALDTADRDVLSAAAVLGSPFGVTELADVVAAPVDDVIAALGRAAAARVIERVAGVGSWAFVHDLFGRAALDGVAADHQVSLHRAAAGTLARADAEPAVVAAHLQAASIGPDAEVARWWIRAGERALGAMAWEEAVVHFERAIAAANGEPAKEIGRSVRVDALLGVGRAKLLLGDVAAAGQAFVLVAEAARAIGDVDLLAQAALAFSADLSGFEVLLFDQRQIDLLEEAAAALDGGGRDALRARVLGRLSVALSWTTSTERRLALAEEAVGLARRGGDDRVLGGVLAAHCDAIAGPDDVGRRLAESEEIIALAERAGDGALELLGRRLRFLALLETGNVVAAEAETQRFARRADALGNPLYRWYVPLWRGMFALARGRPDEAEVAADEAESIGSRAGSVNAPMLATVQRVQILAERSRFSDVFELLGAVGALMQVDESSPPALGQFSYAQFMDGRVEEARATLDLFHASFGELYKDAEWIPSVALALRSAALQRHACLPDLLREAEPYAHLLAIEGIGAGIHGSLARECALARSALGDHDAAVAHGRAAVAANLLGGGLVHAHACRTLADVLEARDAPGDAEEAAKLHASADAAYRAFGFDALVRSGHERERAAAPAAAPAAAAFAREGDVWRVAYAGDATIVKHSKGMADLAALLASPGREIHVTELEGVARDAVDGRGDDALDRTAIEAYRQRLADLADDIDDADAAHDTARAEKARLEYDALVEQLSSSLGLGGRSRAAGPDPVERLRKAVSARVRDAIRRIDAVHPALGRHLTVSVRTGVFCSYRPENPVNWQREVETGA